MHRNGGMLMSLFYNYNSNSISTLFSGLGGTAGMNSTSNILSEYYNIRSGAYKKALTAYYSKIDKNEVRKSNYNSRKSTSTSSSTLISSDSAKTLKNIKSSADNLKNTAGQLVKNSKDSVFKKVEIKGKDGSVKLDYDTDKIYKKVSQFVKNYNDLIDKSDDASSSNIQNTLSNIKRYTDSNSRLLNKIGIDVKENGEMSLDEETFKKSNMTTVKSIFNGTGSYGYYVQSKAAMMSYYAESEASKASTYTSRGGYSYNYSTGEILNSYT